MNETVVNVTSRGSEKSKGMVSMIFKVLTYVKPYGLLAALGSLLVLVNVYFNIKAVLLIQNITNVMSKGNMAEVRHLLLIYVPLFFFLVALMWLGIYLRNYVQSLVNKDLCRELFQHIQELPFCYIQNRHSGDLAERVNKDVEQAVGLIGGNVFSLIENMLICIAAFFYLSSINLVMAFLVLTTGPVTFLAGRFFDRRIRDVSKNIQDKGGEVRGILQEFLQGMPVVRAFNMEEHFHSTFMEARNAQIRIMKKRTLLTVLMWRVVMVTNVAAMLFITYGICSSAIRGGMSIGSVLAFTLLIGRVQWPFINMSRTWGTVQQAYGAAKRVFEILEVEKEGVVTVPYPLKEYKEAAAVVVSNVVYAYEAEGEERKALFDNLNLTLKPGEVTAVVGPSGAGKTSLARLLSGLYMPDKGDISVFGRSLRKELKAARSLLAYVPQSPYLFTGSIRENIAYGREGATETEILEAAKAANAHDFIETLEKGYDTMVGEKGASLSGGQRQRIAIARAFLRKAPLIILDEATSALDNESEYLVQQSMDRLMSGRTVLVIAHRLSTVKNAHRLLVMQEGKIVEEGTHEVLMERKGLYSELYKLQFKE